MVFFTNLCVMEFHGKYLPFFLLFSVINGFGWFLLGSLHKNIQLMLEFLKDPLSVLHFSYYTLMTPTDDAICNIAIYGNDTTP